MKKYIFLDIANTLSINSKSYNTKSWDNLGSVGVEPHLMKRLEYLINAISNSSTVEKTLHISDVTLVLLSNTSLGDGVWIQQHRFKYANIVDKICGKGVTSIDIEDIVCRLTDYSLTTRPAVIITSMGEPVLNENLLEQYNNIKVLRVDRDVGLSDALINEVIEHIKQYDTV